MGKLKGFTIVELMVVMAIFGIVSSLVVGIYFQLVQAANRATIAAEVEQGASYAMEIMVRDIREAGCAEMDAIDTTALNLKDPQCQGVTVVFTTASGGVGVTNLVKTEDLTDYIINNPEKTTVESLTFSVDASGQSVTINLTMESVQPAAHAEFKGRLTLHETVSLRSY